MSLRENFASITWPEGLFMLPFRVTSPNLLNTGPYGRNGPRAECFRTIKVLPRYHSKPPNARRRSGSNALHWMFGRLKLKRGRFHRWFPSQPMAATGWFMYPTMSGDSLGKRLFCTMVRCLNARIFNCVYFRTFGSHETLSFSTIEAKGTPKTRQSNGINIEQLFCFTTGALEMSILR